MYTEVYDSDTYVTLKQGQSHQAWWYELVDPSMVDSKQGYNYVKFEKTCLNIVCKKNFFKVNETKLSNQKTSVISLECVDAKMVVYLMLDVFNNPTKFQLNQIRTTTTKWLKLFDTAATLKYVKVTESVMKR